MTNKLDSINVIDMESTGWEKSLPAGEPSKIIKIGIYTLEI